MTLADALKSAGYATGIFGNGTWAGLRVLLRSARLRRGLRFAPNPNASATSRMTRKALFLTKAATGFMEKQTRPFFAYVAHHAIHTALSAARDTREVHSHARRAHKKRALRLLYDLDDGVGLLLKSSRPRPDTNTLVIFTRQRRHASSQEPLRGPKGGYEGGIRAVHCQWPGVTKPGSRCDVPIINVDLPDVSRSGPGTGTARQDARRRESLTPPGRRRHSPTAGDFLDFRLPGRPVIAARRCFARAGERHSQGRLAPLTTRNGY